MGILEQLALLIKRPVPSWATTRAPRVARRAADNTGVSTVEMAWGIRKAIPDERGAWLCRHGWKGRRRRVRDGTPCRPLQGSGGRPNARPRYQASHRRHLSFL